MGYRILARYDYENRSNDWDGKIYPSRESARREIDEVEKQDKKSKVLRPSQYKLHFKIVKITEHKVHHNPTNDPLGMREIINSPKYKYKHPFQ